MDWYIPLTIIPGVSLIVISTSSIMLSLNNEIVELEKSAEKNIGIISAKLLQLKRVSWSIVFQYIGVLLFLISGIIPPLFPNLGSISTSILLIGVLSICISIVNLIIYSIKAVGIRQNHLQL